MDGVEIHNPVSPLRSDERVQPGSRRELRAHRGRVQRQVRRPSLVDPRRREPRRHADKALTGTSAMSFTDGNVVAEGRLPGTTNGSWLVTGRRTYYDLIAERFVDADLPSFTDLQAKGVWESSKGQRITVFGLQSRERTDARSRRGGSGRRCGARRTHRPAVRDQQRSGRRLVLLADRAARVEQDDGVVVSQSRNAGFRRRSAERKPPIESARRRCGRVFGHRLHAESWHPRRGGPAGHGGAGEPLASAGVRASTATRCAPIGPGGSPAIATATRRTDRAARSARDFRRCSIRTDRRGAPARGSPTNGALTRRLQIEAGLRVDWSGLADETIASPRLAAAMDIGAGLRLRVAGGLFTQSPGYEKLLQSDYFVDLSNADSIGLRSEQARHALVSLERQMPGGLVARVEGYYKRFDHLLLGQLETPDGNERARRDLRFPRQSRLERAERAADHQLPVEPRHRPRLRRRLLCRASGDVGVRSSDRVGVLHVGKGGDDGVRANVSGRLRSPALAQPRRDLSPEPAHRSRHDRARAVRLSLHAGARRARRVDRGCERSRWRRQRRRADPAARLAGPAGVGGGLRRHREPQVRPPAAVRPRRLPRDVQARLDESPLADLRRGDERLEPHRTRAASRRSSHTTPTAIARASRPSAKARYRSCHPSACASASDRF